MPGHFKGISKPITTDRGKTKFVFQDNANTMITVQESPLAMEVCLWFEQQVIGQPPTPSIQLTQNMVKQLLPLLQHFVDCGQLPKI